MADIQISKRYFAKNDIYDVAGYNLPRIPNGAEVAFISQFTNFYGRYIKIRYQGHTYYTKPEMLIKRVIERKPLDSAESGCTAQHKYYGIVTLIAKVVTDNSDKEFWIDKDKNGQYHIIDIADCKFLYRVEKELEEKVTYDG